MHLCHRRFKTRRYQTCDLHLGPRSRTQLPPSQLKFSMEFRWKEKNWLGSFQEVTPILDTPTHILTIHDLSARVAGGEGRSGMYWPNLA